MSKVHPRICANCANWCCFDVDYEFPEDECGACKVNELMVVYGDDDACRDFVSMKYPRIREEDYWM